MNWVDLVVLVLLLLAAIWGGRTGLVAQVISIVFLVVGMVFGGAAAVWLSGRVMRPETRAAVGLAVFAGIASIFYLAGSTIGNHVAHKVPEGGARAADAAGGTVAAMFGVALGAWLLALPLADGPFPAVAEAVKRSFLMRVVTAAPPPPDLIASLRQALKASGFPTVFTQLPETLAQPASPPDPAIATDPDVEAAGASTVKLTGDACSAGSEGSGWVLKPGYVMTNAHVVAGTHGSIRIETRAGKRYKGTVVAFDANRDVAVVFSRSLPLSPVPWTEKPAIPNLSVAALGYPNNGPYTATPGRVNTELDARGKDIYDDRPVRRTVYELAARIRPGNSGGPLVSPSGTVVGMVFAASSTNADIGYALAGSEIAAVAATVGDTSAGVSTGPCR